MRSRQLWLSWYLTKDHCNPSDTYSSWKTRKNRMHSSVKPNFLLYTLFHEVLASEDLWLAAQKQTYLLGFEIMSHKVLLQFLIGVVDAQLLQVIDLKAFEPIHIQNS